MNVEGYVGKSVIRIKQFNELAGNLDNVDKESIALQLDLLQEEYLETVEAYDNNDDAELLDGAIDMHVIATGFLLKLQAAGFKVAEAMERVDLNNLSKYVQDSDPSAAKVLEEAKSKGYSVNHHSGYGMYVIKNANGKVMKPSTFKPVEIGDCAVSGFLRETKEVV